MGRFLIALLVALLTVGLILPVGAQDALPTPRGQLGGGEPLTPPPPAVQTPTASPTPEPETPTPAATETPSPTATVAPSPPAATPVAAAAATPAMGTTGTTGRVGLEGLPEVVARVAPSVVTVAGESPIGQVASGVIVEDGRHVVTVAEPLAGTAALGVIDAEGTRHSATLVGSDPLSGLALLEVDAEIGPPLALAEREVPAGSLVLAVGTAYGSLPGTVSLGVVSSGGRPVPAGPPATVLVQHDGVLPPGGEGGALVDLEGALVGIVLPDLGPLAAAPQPGGVLPPGEAVPRPGDILPPGTAPLLGAGDRAVAFAVPAATVRRVVEALLAEGRVAYPFLGASFAPVTEPADAVPAGAATVLEVVPDGPADRAGIEEGDVIVAIGDERLSPDRPFGIALLSRSPGETVDVRIVRDGAEETIAVTLEERPAE